MNVCNSVGKVNPASGEDDFSWSLRYWTNGPSRELSESLSSCMNGLGRPYHLEESAIRLMGTIMNFHYQFVFR